MALQVWAKEELLQRCVENVNLGRTKSISINAPPPVSVFFPVCLQNFWRNPKQEITLRWHLKDHGIPHLWHIDFMASFQLLCISLKKETIVRWCIIFWNELAHVKDRFSHGNLTDALSHLISYKLLTVNTSVNKCYWSKEQRMLLIQTTAHFSVHFVLTRSHM